jgi:hypothetical protein
MTFLKRPCLPVSSGPIILVYVGETGGFHASPVNNKYIWLREASPLHATHRCERRLQVAAPSTPGFSFGPLHCPGLESCVLPVLRVSTEFRRHGIPRNFLTSEVISAQFRRNSAKFRGISPELSRKSLPYSAECQNVTSVDTLPVLSFFYNLPCSVQCCQVLPSSHPVFSSVALLLEELSCASSTFCELNILLMTIRYCPVPQE